MTSAFSTVPTPPGIYLGTRAVTSQSYTEANVKNGLQFEFSSYNPTLASNTPQYAVFKTGSKPVLLKSRIIAFTGTSISADVYVSPTYTGGTLQGIYNLRTDNKAIATTSQIISGVTPTNNGTKIAATTYGIGSSGNGQSVLGSFTVSGVERLLSANSEYLLEIKNTSASTCAVAVYATWYEGEPDLPTND